MLVDAAHLVQKLRIYVVEAGFEELLELLLKFSILRVLPLLNRLALALELLEVAG